MPKANSSVTSSVRRLRFRMNSMMRERVEGVKKSSLSVSNLQQWEVQ